MDNRKKPDNKKITFLCNVTNSRFTVGYKSKSVDPEDRVQFSLWIAEEIASMLVKAIEDQKYRKKWIALSPNYLEWKKKQHYSPNIWECTGMLKLEVKYWRRHDVVNFGIGPTKRYPDGTSVLKVARWMEYGTKNMPERPLFRPIISYIRKNISYMYAKFKTMKNVSVKITDRNVRRTVSKKIEKLEEKNLKK